MGSEMCIRDSVMYTVTTTRLYWPKDISVTRGRELIFIHDNSDTVNIVRDGKCQTLITAPKGWTPGGLCCTRSGDILVHVYRVQVYKESGRRTENKIIRFQGKNIKHEINNDREGIHIFKNGKYSLYMSENNNGDVCVSDVNA